MIKVINGKVAITEAGKLYKPLYDLYAADKTTGRIRFHRYISWIFYVYSNSSDNPYSGYLPTERKEKVWETEFDRSDQLKPERMDKRLKEIIAEFIYLSTSDTDRLIEGTRKKIEDFLKFFDTISVSHENYRQIQDMIISTKGLIAYRKELEQQHEKEEQRYRGGSRPKLFELPKS